MLLGCELPQRPGAELRRGLHSTEGCSVCQPCVALSSIVYVLLGVWLRRSQGLPWQCQRAAKSVHPILFRGNPLGVAPLSASPWGLSTSLLPLEWGPAAAFLGWIDEEMSYLLNTREMGSDPHISGALGRLHSSLGAIKSETPRPTSGARWELHPGVADENNHSPLHSIFTALLSRAMHSSTASNPASSAWLLLAQWGHHPVHSPWPCYWLCCLSVLPPSSSVSPQPLHLKRQEVGSPHSLCSHHDGKRHLCSLRLK